MTMKIILKKTICLAAIITLVIIMVLFSSQGCQSDNDTSKVALITLDYPFGKSIFPPEIVAPTFLWHDPERSANIWLVEIAFQDTVEQIKVFTEGQQPERQIDPNANSSTNADYKLSDYELSAKAWTPDELLWNKIKTNSVEKNTTITITGINSINKSNVLSKGSVQITVSKDPVGAPIFYRDVPLMPSENTKGEIKPLAKRALPLIKWRLRDISKASAPVVLKDMPTCANCHSFSNDGKTLGMDMDGPSGDKGAYGIAPIEKEMVITEDDIITWNSFKYKPKGHKTIGFFSSVSPDGKYVVSTVNESLFVKNYTDFRFLQSFYAVEGILAIYSKVADTMEPLPGADDPKYVQSNGCWSPDGKDIVFSRALTKEKVVEKMPEYSGDPHELQIQYDLYRIPFNDGAGGKPKQLEGASQNGMSNSFPKYSPDGKWIVYVQAQNGQLMRPDSKLYIIPAAGGQARKMNCNINPMNSWHSWSPNSRWLVFASKGFSPFTQMFLTHIDENGNDSPAILIPNSTAANRAINIPEFLNNEQDAITSMSAPTQESFRHYNDGTRLMQQSKIVEAVLEFEKALELNPYDIRSYHNLGLMFSEQNKFDRAVQQFQKALQVDPNLAITHDALGNALTKQGKFTEAITHFTRALEIKPDSEHRDSVLTEREVTHEMLADSLAILGRIDEAIEHYNEALGIKPDLTGVIFKLAKLYKKLGKYNLAIENYNHLLELIGNNANILTELGVVLRDHDKIEEAIEKWKKALAIDPNNAFAHFNMALVMSNQNDYEQAIGHFNKALRSKPDFVTALNNLAWLLATIEDDKFRDPQKAINLSKKACELTNYKQPAILNTLAAAYAAAGKFPEAVINAEKALKLAEAAGQEQLAERIRNHLQSYKAGKQ